MNILIADDSVPCLIILKRYLEIMGHSVEVAKDGNELTEKFEKGKYSLIITDIHMGYDNIGLVVDVIREIDYNIVIVGITATDGYTDNHFNYVLYKPVSPASIMRMFNILRNGGLLE